MRIFAAILLSCSWISLFAADELTIRIVDGESAAYPAGSRATRGITVAVLDGAGRPVEGALVAFSLPSSGPGGAFASGSRTEIAATKSDGQAAIWGMQWNRTEGAFEIRITASKGALRGSATCTQILTGPGPGAAPPGRIRSSGSHKLLWIALAVGGGAGAALAGLSSGKTASSSSGSGSSSPGSPGSIQIGAPTITLGHP